MSFLPKQKKGAGRQRDEGEPPVVLEDGVEHRGKPDDNHGALRHARDFFFFVSNPRA